jgi:hypothetical protein
MTKTLYIQFIFISLVILTLWCNCVINKWIVGEEVGKADE